MRFVMLVLLIGGLGLLARLWAGLSEYIMTTSTDEVSEYQPDYLPPGCDQHCRNDRREDQDPC